MAPTARCPAAPRSRLVPASIGLALVWLAGCAAHQALAEAGETSADAAADSLGVFSSDFTVSDSDHARRQGDVGPGIVAGAADRILLVGHVIGPDSHFDGQVLVHGALIACAAPGTLCASDPAAAGATVVDTGGVIFPGLIDTHNHILFDIFDNDDWLPAKTYQDHTEWPNEARYGDMLDVKQCLENASQGKPSWCANTPYGSPSGNVKCEMNKWGELKGLIAGTTAIVGLPGTAASCFGGLARSIDTAHNGLGQDKIQTSAIFPPSQAAADGVCNNFANGTTDAYLVHVGEGINAKALGEFQTLFAAPSADGCLHATGTTITHGTAFGMKEFEQMAAAGMKLTWSPASNVALYGTTTNIPLARQAGVTVALAPDWSMGGSQNMLDELRFADAWDDQHWGNSLTAQDLVRMTTVHAAQAIGLGSTLGKLEKGYLADMVVIVGNTAKPYDAVLAARPQFVNLVLVGGVPLYGASAWQWLARQNPDCEGLSVCGADKFVCVATPDATRKAGQTFVQIKAVLEKAMLDVDAQTPADGHNFAPLAPVVRCEGF